MFVNAIHRLQWLSASWPVTGMCRKQVMIIGHLPIMDLLIENSFNHILGSITPFSNSKMLKIIHNLFLIYLQPFIFLSQLFNMIMMNITKISLFIFKTQTLPLCSGLTHFRPVLHILWCVTDICSVADKRRFTLYQLLTEL